MHVRTFSLTVALASLTLGAFLLVAPAHAGSESGTNGLGASCTRSSQCQSDLRCNLLDTYNDTELEYDKGELKVKSGVPNKNAQCIPAYSDVGDDCNLYDCHRRNGLVCDPRSTAIAFSGGYDYGECNKKSSVDAASKDRPLSWNALCHEKHTGAQLQACLDLADKTCVAESECQSNGGYSFTGLVCNTGYTNFGGLFTPGRSGRCVLPGEPGEACEEDGDCYNTTCDTTTNTCKARPGSAASGGAGGAGGAGAGGGLAVDGQPADAASGGNINFGLQIFRNSNVGLRTDSPQALVAGMTRVVLGVLALILIGLIIYGGIIYMTSAGNEKRVENGKQIITWAIIGMVVVAAAYIIAEFVIRALIA